MAMLIKDRYRLMTLRCWIGFRAQQTPNAGAKSGYPSERVVRTQLFDGKDPIGDPQDTAFEQLGLTPSGQPPAKAWLPLVNGTPIGDQLRRATANDPAVIWLHIPQDSYPLALLPWEEMAVQVVKTPVLRIGNFVDDPYKPGEQPVIAVCASQPIADGFYELVEFVITLLASIEQAAKRASVSPNIIIFVDAQSLPIVRDRVAAHDSLPRNVIIREPPQDSGDAVPTAPSSGTPGASRWLKWITDSLSGMSVDIVHFVSPGWYSDNHGAIALAESPTRNSGGGEFVGAAELGAFYDKLGCRVMAFSSPDMPQWEWGQRMLAFELSWLRAGPVLVFEHGISAYEGLTNMYHLLFGGGSEAIDLLPYQQSPPQLTCHPQILEPVDLPTVTPEKSARLELDFFSIGGDDVLSRHLDQAMAQLQPTRAMSKTEHWEATGVASALDFVKSLN
jgi:hypothetical protein